MSAGTRMIRSRVAHRLDAGGRYPRSVLLVALSGLFATTFPVTVLTLAIPTMAEDFDANPETLSWVVTLPVLCSALALPALGKLGDLYGHRRVFLVGFSLAVVTTALTATATSPLLLIGWRTISQVLGGSTMPSSLALISTVHHGESRARAMGWWAMVSAGAPVVGLLLGAPAIDLVGWQALFMIQALLMVVPVMASWLVLRETPPKQAQFDIPGMIALTVGIGPLLLAVTQAPDWGISSPVVIAFLAVSAVGLAWFYLAERRAPAPLLPVQLVRSRDAVAALTSAFFTGAAYMGGFFLASLLMVEQFGYSSIAAVPILAVRPALFASTSPVGGRITGSAGTRAAAVAGCLSLAGGLTGLVAGSAAGSLPLVVAGGFILQGIGFGLLRPAITTALANAVPQEDLGVAGATERLIGQLGVAFGIALMAATYGGQVDRFPPAFGVGVGFALLGLLAALAMRRLAPTPGGRTAALDRLVKDGDNPGDADRSEGDAMPVSYQEALAQVTGPGQRFETERITAGGIPYTIFRNAPANLRQLLASARSRGDDTFLVHEDERWSFSEVMERVDALGALLVEEHGVAKGDRVAIAMRNYPEWVISFAAVTSVGAISVSINAWWTADELDYALEDSGTSVLIADPERIERAADAAKRLGVRMLAVRAPEGADLPAGTDRWEDVLPLGRPLPEVDIEPGDDATILYTSGTTGKPKGAVSTHRAVVQALMGFGCRSAIDRTRRQAGPAPAEGRPVFILIVPLFHVTGAIPVMLSCFANGLRLVMMYRWDPDRALELIERERVTNFVGVPTQSWDLLESPRFGEHDTSSLLSVGGGGAPAPPQLVQRVEANFRRGRPSIGYGLTETNAYGPGHVGDDYVANPTSTGRVTPILEVQVRDPEGRPLPVGEQGEIWFRGPNLARGYWNKPEATAEVFTDGWFRTGDIGRVDSEGFVYVEDRAKDMILRGGENVYCSEVEAAIYEHPAVHEAAVFGVPHERLGEEVAAAVVPREGRTVTAEQIREHVGARLAGFKVPTRIVLSQSRLPRNAAGKILKRSLRDGLTADEPVSGG